MHTYIFYILFFTQVKNKKKIKKRKKEDIDTEYLNIAYLERIVNHMDSG